MCLQLQVTLTLILTAYKPLSPDLLLIKFVYFMCWATLSIDPCYCYIVCFDNDALAFLMIR